MNRLLTAALILLTATTVVYSQVDTLETSATQKDNRLSFVITGMGGLSQQIAHSSENYNYLHIGVGLQYAISESWAFRIEALPFVNAVGNEDFIEDVRGFGGLGSVLYYFGDSDVRFYGELNAGGAQFDEEIPVGGATKFNFLLGLGVGVEVPVSGSSNIILGYRYYHVSNSNTGDRNPGINAHSALVGMRFGF